MDMDIYIYETINFIYATIRDVSNPNNPNNPYNPNNQQIPAYIHTYTQIYVYIYTGLFFELKRYAQQEFQFDLIFLLQSLLTKDSDSILFKLNPFLRQHPGYSSLSKHGLVCLL